MDIPADPSSITAHWLTDALRSDGVLGGASVETVTATDIGEGTGIFGEIARLDLSYSGDADGAPASVVVKLPCIEPENLAVAQALGIYRREIAFFEHIAPTTSLRVPTCHLARMDDDGRFVLLLEDMSVDYEVGDQVVGATLAQAEAAVDALAGLHAPWWESDALHALDWLPVPDAPEYMAAVPGIYRAGLPVLEADWADRVPGASVDIARRLDPVFEALLTATGQGAKTFTHADTRLDNIFFARNGHGHEPEVAFIDFQLCLKARGVTDLAYMIGTSVQRDVAAEHWEGLLRRWHAHITDAGIDYPWDTAVAEYKECALYYLCGAMSLIGTFDSGNDRGAAMTEAYVTRVFHHVVDAECAGAVPD